MNNYIKSKCEMIKIRELRQEDVESVVKIHCESFKGFFLTSLGPRFLWVYYTCFISSDETVSLCAEKDDEILGFAVSTKKSKGFNSRLVKSNFASFCKLALRLSISSPSSVLRLIKNFSKKSDTVEDNEDYAELYSIGVLPCSQGLGIGGKLLRETERVMLMNGVKRLTLTTDIENNDKAVTFYTSLGYNVMYKFKAFPNRWMYRLIKVLLPY